MNQKNFLIIVFLVISFLFNTYNSHCCKLNGGGCKDASNK